MLGDTNYVLPVYIRRTDNGKDKNGILNLGHL